MRLSNIKQLDGFLQAVDACKGQVWLESPDGDKYNLKSEFSKYLALGALLNARGDELELFCQESSDEHLFYDFFYRNPDVL